MLAVVAALIAGVVMFFNYKATADQRTAADEFYEQKQWDKAIDSYTEVIRRDPKDVRAYVARGCAYEWKGQTDKAISDYTEALRRDPGYSYAYGNRGRAYATKGELDRAIRDEDKAISLDPQGAANYVSRGFVYVLQGDFDKAASDYAEAIQLDPDNGAAYAGRGYMFSLQGEWAKVIDDYTEAINRDSKDAATYIARAYAYVQRDECEKAINDYREAIRLNPANPQPYNDLAWLFATSSVITVRDGKEAVAMAKKACELDAWKHSATVDTLAAAFAEAGDFAEAIKYQKQALSMTDVTDKYRADGQRRLSLYQQGKPYRETPK
jgi:tetratricopeptide (TPR) repeat protein